jgi:hypothetical protein
VGGFAGFGVYGGRASSLQKHGVRATATVTAAALYTGRYSRNSFTEHIDVDFVTPTGVVRGVRIPIGETDRFRVGQEVEIAYDPSDPHRAVLAHGYADIGPIGFPLFFALVLGACLLVVGIRGLRLVRGARRALAGSGRKVEVASELVRSGRAGRCALSLRGEWGESVQLWSVTRRGWYPLLQPVEATAFGSAAPGSIVVVADPRRGAATAGRVWKARRLPFSAPHLPAVRPGLWPAVLLAIVAAGLAASAISAVWVARVVGHWQESKRIQSGPQVLATIVATGKAAGGSQEVTLRYSDRRGVPHRLELRFPLGLAASVLPGRTTTVAYDPRSPDKAELAGHPRTRWQSVVLAVVTFLGLFLVSVWAAAALWLGFHRERAHRHHVGAGIVTVLGLLAVGVRLVFALVGTGGAQGLPFPPSPPPLRTGRVAPLPAVLSLAPPASAPLVTPAQARRVVAAAWPLRDRVLASRDLSTLEAIEAGPALVGDEARMRSGGPPNRPNASAHAPREVAVYVPRQRRWPLRFLAEGVTTSAGKPFLELMIFRRSSPRSRWQVVYDTGYGRGTGPPLSPEPAILDAQGYDVVPPHAEIPAGDAVPALARYWQAWLDHPSPPVAIPAFLPGTWTTDYGESVAGKQDGVAVNGHPAHVVYGDRPSPRGQLWTFGVDGDRELVCSPMHQTTTWSGTSHQDAARSNWGPDLAPGAYSSITADIVREPCIIVPPSGGLVAFGADRWVVRLSGRR